LYAATKRIYLRPSSRRFGQSDGADFKSAIPVLSAFNAIPLLPGIPGFIVTVIHRNLASPQRPAFPIRPGEFNVIGT